MSCTRLPAELAGLTDAQMQTWLTATQQAIQDLTVGGKVETMAYAQGDGSRSATYTRAALPALRARAQMLAQALGLVERRRPMRPFF